MEHPMVMDLVLKLIGIEEFPEAKELNPSAWLYSEGVIDCMVSYLGPTHPPHIQATASMALVDALSLMQAMCPEKLESNLLIQALKKKTTIEAILHHMMCSPDIDASFEHGAAILLELLRHPHADPTRSNSKSTPGSESPFLDPLDPFLNSSSPLDLTILLTSLSSHLPEFFNLLQKKVPPSPPNAPFASEPLGIVPFTICKLVSELLQSALAIKTEDTGRSTSSTSTSSASSSSSSLSSTSNSFVTSSSFPSSSSSSMSSDSLLFSSSHSSTSPLTSPLGTIQNLSNPSTAFPSQGHVSNSPSSPSEMESAPRVKDPLSPSSTSLSPSSFPMAYSMRSNSPSSTSFPSTTSCFPLTESRRV
ncbi:hypothetical protein HMI54_005345 [Coelomomyces lativittatus]|nr:hypothetical protein HMI54_005345 [Coelomomyces lativittatus]